ncbi:helix-turn-helix domain-containing protein [Leptotrichia massiliensis]|uniref:helix-turn-helix domain-containing protein n=1 Tax=Leptotrichia massiliensis TaxID=1852388 RepID=UPI0008D987E5|nr:helix-turn-helix domain-containing protein [Leptotrichia massiliensis]
MATFRVNKTSDYTVISNYHLREKEMSLKAKGLLTLMLSLPGNWDYSISGLASICAENETAIKTGLKELKKFGYLKISKIFPNKERGNKKIEYVYEIFEKPLVEGKRQKEQETEKQPVEKQKVENQGVENLPLESQAVENQGQLSTKELNTNKLNTKEVSTKEYIHVKNEFSQACEDIKNKWIKIAQEYDLSGKQLKIDDKRKKAIKNLFKEYSVEELLQAIDKIHISKFMQGDNKNKWQVTFDWLIKKANLLKVLEGNYDDKINTEIKNNANTNNKFRAGVQSERPKVTAEGLRKYFGGSRNDNGGI